MKKITTFLLVAVLTACGQSETPREVDTSEVNVPTVDELAANPERLKELRQQCKTDRPRLGEVLCNRVAEAIATTCTTRTVGRTTSPPEGDNALWAPTRVGLRPARVAAQRLKEDLHRPPEASTKRLSARMILRSTLWCTDQARCGAQSSNDSLHPLTAGAS